jgi:3,4-dihydroxy 2-butanone 4-phosphate synthase / GTP cyclohydrolase II
MPYDQKRVVEAIRAFERGEIVVVMDDDGRENEGDLIVAAVHCTPEKMAFIVRHTSGIVCTPMPREEARRLNLAPMVAENDAPHATAFTVSVDFKHGTTTGISAEDRTLTVRNLANPMPVRRISCARDTSSRWSRARAGCSCARATPRRRSICASSPACRPSA